jgi:glycerophosphoryl diester phosphodiesterase
MERRDTQSRSSVDESIGSGRQVVAEFEDILLASGLEHDGIRVLGHRGSPAAPGRAENSVAAVTEALRQGADGVEIDVRLTADGVLVCAHNPVAVGRTGALLDVATSASADLLDDVDGKPLATLAELLAAGQRPSGSRIVVEVKPVPDLAVARETARVLADVLAASAGSAEITLSSFDPVLLGLVRRACADLPVRTALLGDKEDPVEAIVRRADEDGHDEVHLPLVGLRRSPQVVETARSLGLSVGCWTVNRRQDLRWVAALGVDSVITDDVPTARRELDRAAVLEQAAA